MPGYQLTIILLAAALTGLTAAVIVGVLKWIETSKVSTTLLSGGTAFFAVATTTTTITMAIATADA